MTLELSVKELAPPNLQFGGALSVSDPKVGLAQAGPFDLHFGSASRKGDILDGEGGYTVWGKLLPSHKSVQLGGVPLGLAHDVKVIRPVPQGQVVTWADVAMDTTTRAYQLRMELEALK